MLRGNESTEHAKAKLENAIELVGDGYKVWFEKEYRTYVVDVFAKNDEDIVILEVGKTTSDKMDDLDNIKNVSIKNIPYYKDGDMVVGVRKSSTSGYRPKLAEAIEIWMEEENSDGNKLYKEAGYNSKSSFIGQAAKEKIEDERERLDWNN